MTAPASGEVLRQDAVPAQGRRVQYAFFGRIPWDGVWLNRHYLAKELSRRERVAYILDPKPLNPFRHRSADRVDFSWHLQPHAGPPGVQTFRPLELPFQQIDALRRASDNWPGRFLARWAEEGVPLVSVYFPRAKVPEPGALGESLSVYFAPDEFRFHKDGTRDEEFCRWEDEILRRCQLVITVTAPLVESFSKRHPRVRLVENGFDPEFFRPWRGEVPPDMRDLPRPVIGFVGTVRPPLIDLEMMARVADARPSWTLCLVGWNDEGNPALKALRSRRNVRILGPRRRESLAGYIAAMDVLTSPYEKCMLTAAAFPLKAWESLAVGRPLVATHAPLLNRMRPHLRSADSEKDFLAELQSVLSRPPAGSESLAAPHRWECRAATLRGHVVAELDRLDRAHGAPSRGGSRPEASLRSRDAVAEKARQWSATSRDAGSLVFGSFARYRDLLGLLVLREIRIRYARALLGAGWAILVPLVITGIFLSLDFGRLIPTGSRFSGVPYGLFALCGILPWTYFAGALTQATPSIVNARDIIRKSAFPRETIPLSKILAGLLDLALGALLFAGFVLWSGRSVGPQVMVVPVILILQIAFTLGLGLLLSAGNTLFRDVHYIVQVALPIGMFATSVVYPVSAHGDVASLMAWNPMTSYIDAYREAILLGVWPWRTLVPGLIGAAAALCLGAWAFTRLERRFAEEL